MKKLISFLISSIMIFSLISSQAVSATTLNLSKEYEINRGPVIDDNRGGDAKLIQQATTYHNVAGMRPTVLAGFMGGLVKSKLSAWGVPYSIQYALGGATASFIYSMGYDPYSTTHIAYLWQQPDGKKYAQTITYFYDASGKLQGSRILFTDLY